MFELRFICPQESVESVSEALDALDALSVSVEDADAQTDSEQALFGEPGMPAPREGWQRSRIIAHFATQALAQEALALLEVQDFFAGSQVLGIGELQQQDWVRLTQSQFAPVDITPTFWIVPTWHDVPPQASVVIRLDPGLAFGTGTHPTTRMCLRWIANYSRRNQDPVAKGLGRVLDYGCGSGILAIATAKFGALEVDGVDIDEAATNATLLNAQVNGVTLRTGMPETVTGVYQTVLANILATPLKVLAPLLWSRVAPGGSLVLAGILERQAQELADAYAPHCKLLVADREDGWILMTSKR
jgi:ribosomal protein L11 methyltransferase